MNKVVLVTGGSRSGKSTYAENIYSNRDDILYIATAIVTDDEMRERISRHIESRNQNWKTYEGFKDLDIAIRDFHGYGVLLDCVTIMITNLLFEKERDYDNFSKEDMDEVLGDIKEELNKLISEAKKRNLNLVMVTNEVGYGIVPEYKISRIYRDIAGFVNQHIASLSDEVYLVACGLPLKLK